MKKFLISIALILVSFSVFGQVTETTYQNSVDSRFSGRTSKQDLIDMFEDTKDVIYQYKGTFVNLAALQAAHAVGADGEFAIVNGDFYTWKSAAWTIVSGGGGSGETNTASNSNATGVGVFATKSGVDFEFNGVVDDGGGSIDVVLDDPNNEIEIGVSDNGIQLVNMADNSVQAAEIVDGSVGAAEIGTDAVDSDEIASGAVQSDEIDVNAVTNTKMADNAINTAEIVDDAVANNDLSNMASYTIKMRDDVATGDPEDVKITGTTLEPAPAAGDFIILELADGSIAHADISNLPSSGGAVSTASNLGTGEGLFKQLNGTDLEFYSLAPDGAASLTVQTSLGSNEVRIGVENGGITSTHIANNTVSDGDLEDVPGNTIKGRDNNSTGNPENLTISAITEETTPSAGDVFLAEDGATGELRHIDFSSLPGAAGGEANTASGIGSGGVSVFNQKSGVDLQFNNIQSGTSATIQVLDDAANNEIDLNLIAGSVVNTYIADDAINSAKIANSSIASADIADGTITGDDIGDGQVSNADLVDMAAYTVKMRANGTAGDAQDLLLSQLSEEGAPASGDMLLIADGVTDQLRFVNWNQVGAGGSGETNDGANVNVAGVGVYDGKSGTDIQFRGVSGNGTIDVSLDDVDNEIQLSVPNNGIGENQIANNAVTTNKISDNAVSNFDLDDMTAWTIKGRASGTSGDPGDFKISSLSTESSPASGDFVMIERAEGDLLKVDAGDFLSGGGGETNTISNVGVSGITVVAGKSGVDLQLNSIVGNSQIDVVLDDPNNEVELSIAANSIGISQISTGGVATGEILDGTILTSDLATGSVQSVDILDDSITASDIGSGAVGSSEIATDAVDSDEIISGAVGASELATNAVTNVDVADNAIGSAEIIDNSITGDDIGSNAVGSSEINSGAVGTSEIASNAVDNIDMADMAGYTFKMRNNSSSGDPQDVKISAFTEESAPESGDWVAIELATGEVRKADIDNFTSYGAWQDVTISHADWTEDTNKPVRYRLITVQGEDWLELAGEMTFDGAGNGIDIFNLPASFRPSFERWLLAFVPSNVDSQVAVRIETNGNVSVQRVDNQAGSDELVIPSTRIPLF